MINIFIGYDSKEQIAYHTLSQSILRHATRPVSITPLYLPNIKYEFSRERSNIESTEFSFSRFIVPHLMNYKGWALFMDCDMLMKTDISKLWALRDDRYAVQVCKHNYIPKEKTKFLGQVQTVYPKKNWSSFMLMNCKKCTALTPDYVNTTTGSQLHQFKWLDNEDLIGNLPIEWNWLVGEYEYKKDVNNVHFTKGGPYFKEYMDCDYSSDWFNEYTQMVKIELE